MRRIFIIVSSVCLLVFLSPVTAKESLTIVTNDYWPLTSTDVGKKGFALELCEKVFERLKEKVSFDYYPWKRCEYLVQRGDALAAVPYYRTAAREKIYDYSEPLLNRRSYFFYNRRYTKPPKSWKSYGDFKEYIMGAALGYWYMPYFKAAKLELNISSSEKAQLTKLIHGRIDFMLIDEAVGTKLIMKHYPGHKEDILKLEPAARSETIHLIFSRKFPKSKALLRRFNKELKLLKASSYYSDLLKKYNLKN